MSTDFGDHWSVLATIPGLYLFGIAVSSDGSTIYLATRGGGVLSYTI